MAYYISGSADVFKYSLIHCIFILSEDTIQFIHSGYFYSASSNPLLLRGAPDYSIVTVSELKHRSATETVSEGLSQSPYVVAGVGFKISNLRPSGCKAPNLPLSHHAPNISICYL